MLDHFDSRRPWQAATSSPEPGFRLPHVTAPAGVPRASGTPLPTAMMRAAMINPATTANGDRMSVATAAAGVVVMSGECKHRPHHGAARMRTAHFPSTTQPLFHALKAMKGGYDFANEPTRNHSFIFQPATAPLSQ